MVDDLFKFALRNDHSVRENIKKYSKMALTFSTETPLNILWKTAHCILSEFATRVTPTTKIERQVWSLAIRNMNFD